MRMKSTYLDTSKPPLVSVVVPIYNGAEYLEQCLVSVLKSTYSHFEIIIIDDGSTDTSKQIINKYVVNDARIRAIFNKSNIGLSKSLNKAIRCAKGKYIARVNQDDVIDPKRIELQAKYMSSHKNTVCLGTYAEYIDENSNKLGRVISLPTDDRSLRNKWKYTSPFADPTVMYVRAAAIRAGLYDSGYWPADDSQFWYRIGQYGKLVNLPKILTKIRIHTNAISQAKFRKMAYQIFRTRRYLHNNIQSVSVLVQLFWICQLIASLLLPQKISWIIYHAIIRSYSK